MTATDLDRIRISSPDDLIEAIPYLLGFHPCNSVVLVGFAEPALDRGSTHRVEVVLRADLPFGPVGTDDLRALITALRRSPVQTVVCVVFTDDGLPEGSVRSPFAELTEHLGSVLSDTGIELMDVLLASHDRWWSLLCADPTCCPPAGLDRAVGYSQSAAQATVAGLVALEDRDQLRAQFDGLADEERHALDGQLADAENRMTRALLDNGLRRLRRTDLNALFRSAERLGLAECADPVEERGSVRASAGRAARSPLTPAQLARFGVALTDLTMRDEVWLGIDERSVDALLRELFRRLPAPYDATPLFLYGWQLWREGNGALACMAAERALASDAQCSAATLLLCAVEGGLNPHSTPPLRDTPDFD
jgi:hypothetical protein